MDEKYINIIYDILSNDKNFVKNSPVSEFVNKIKDEEENEYVCIQICSTYDGFTLKLFDFLPFTHKKR